MPVYESERHYEKLPLLASREELRAIRTLLEDEQIDCSFTQSSLRLPHNDASVKQYKFTICAFCAGNHYSDGCHRITKPSERLETSHDSRKCVKCLMREDAHHNCRAHKRCRYCNEDTHHPSLCRIPLVHYEYQKITQIKVTRPYNVYGHHQHAKPNKQHSRKKNSTSTCPECETEEDHHDNDANHFRGKGFYPWLKLFADTMKHPEYNRNTHSFPFPPRSWTDITDELTKAFKSSIEIVNAQGELCEMKHKAH
ncbi:unnamed protein product [Caenorhabditis auriculariae]|uniref:Uncharacterized protein n=1 Tax=Caenorhabditis auriculariae TaxID=2777116 RepID=A0A8S1HTD6_9PELO|nr:unnamed protein product [Caenorhabditis auriculariae]